MCDGQDQPSSVTGALGMLDRALDYLNAADAASLPSSVQAEALRALERAAAKHTAARASVLAAFAGQAAYEDDGQGSIGAWLRWQTRITKGAAAGAVGWIRRLADHPVIADALAAGDLSESWSRQVCAWTDRLPEGQRGDADEILVAAAHGGVDLPGLAGLAQEMYERSHRDGDGDGGFGDRALWLDTTLGGVGRLTGDLTAGCSAALTAVLEALGKRAGPEDLRTATQRRHDALEEACRRLVASGMLPGRAGQPTQVQVHVTLSQLRGLPGAPAAEAAWAAARSCQPGWLTGPEANAASCDATVVPIVTGHVDPAALDQLTEIYLASRGHPPGAADHVNGATGEVDEVEDTADHPPGAADHVNGATGKAGEAGDTADHPPGVADHVNGATGKAGEAAGTARGAGASNGAAGRASGTAGRPCGGAGRPASGCDRTCGRCACHTPAPLTAATRKRLRRTLLGPAADVLSGPGGLAAELRTGVAGAPLAAVSLPLDIGPATETIPAHLRRAVTVRHPHCAFPGCEQPASVCEIHHIIPRSRGGPTSLANLVTMCVFHHLTVIHRWGWDLRLNSDGTTTATSPRGQVLHSHSPPRQAA